MSYVISIMKLFITTMIVLCALCTCMHRHSIAYLYPTIMLYSVYKAQGIITTIKYCELLAFSLLVIVGESALVNYQW